MTVSRVVDNTEARCACCTRHVPLPMSLYAIDVQGRTWYACPTAWSNVEHLLHQYEVSGGKPSGAVTKHYGKMIRDIAELIYSQGG